MAISLRRSENPHHALPDLLLHFLNTLARVDIFQRSQPPVVTHQRRGLLLVRMQSRCYHFFTIVRPLNQLAAIYIANAFDLRRAVENIINLAALTADPSPGQPPHQDRRPDDHVNHERLLQSMLLQQLAQVPRLSDRPRKTVEDEAVKTIHSLDALGNDSQHQRIRHQLPALHNRLGLQTEWSAGGNLLAKHVAGRKMRHAKLPRQLFRLRTFSRARRSEKNNRARQLSDRAFLRRHLAPPLSAAAQAALSRKPLVIAHDELCLQLLHRIHRHAHYDQERSAPKIKSHTKPVQDPLREVPVKPVAAEPVRQVV